ncbi:MAG: hypothetical protein AABN34_06735 [Acidobacteriota bacterium]
MNATLPRLYSSGGEEPRNHRVYVDGFLILATSSQDHFKGVR